MNDIQNVGRLCPQSARGLAQSKSFAPFERYQTARQRFGLRQSSGAFDAQPNPSPFTAFHTDSTLHALFTFHLSPFTF